MWFVITIVGVLLLACSIGMVTWVLEDGERRTRLHEKGEKR